MAADDTERRPCGLYRTTRPIEGKVPAGVLVYYHNHGDPGPGVYPVERWAHNKAIFSSRGILTPDDAWAASLDALAPEGFYRVERTFHCCAKKCRSYDPGLLVQLGYNGRAEPILFVPTWSERGLELPKRGNKIERENMKHLSRLSVNERFAARDDPPTPAPPTQGRGYLH